MRVVVTGSSGFIGNHLVDRLLDEEHTVIRFPRDMFARPDVMEDFLTNKKPDVIYHLAAYGNMANQYDVADMINANYIGTFNLLQATKDIPYKALIYVSSSSVLLEHETIYSATKAGAERLCTAFVDEYNKPIITVRPFSVYGPSEARFRFIPTAFRSCLEGEPMRLDPYAKHDWVYVDDVVDTLIKAAEAIAASELFETVNCGTGEATSNIEVIGLIEKITGKKSNYILVEDPLRSFDSKDWPVADIDPIDKKNRITLKQGLEKYYYWYTGLSK